MRFAALLALTLGACYGPDVALGLPCSDTRQCPAGQECDVLANVCTLPTEARVWRDDTAADFATPGAQLEGATIEAAGFVGPRGYLVGGARLAGIQSHLIGDPATTTWAQVAAGTITGRGFTRSGRVDFGTAAPTSLGLTTGDDITVLIEFEVMLAAVGDWRFQLTANDRGFLEIAPPGGDFAPLVADVNNDTIAGYAVATAGWHRVRGAIADASMVISFDLRVDPPGLGGFRSLTVDEIRAQGDDLTGWSVDGFDGPNMIDPVQITLAADTLLNTTLGSNAYGLEVGSGDWSLRWAGQIRIETEGAYALRLETTPGHRWWIDGALVADKYADGAAVTMAPPMQLVAGWHDIVIDVDKDTGPSGRIAMTVADGPMWTGQAIPLDHIRPVIGRATRWVGNDSTAIQSIPDQGTTTKSVSVGLPASFTPFAVDVGYTVDHPILDTLEVVLDPPNGADVTLAAVGAITGAGTRYLHSSVPTSRAGTTWAFAVTDGTLDVMAGEIEYAGVTMVYAGGVAPFPTRATYVSAARDLADVVGLGAVTWQLRQTDVVDVAVRTCDEVAGCEAEPWTTVQHGAVPAVEARRFVQYRVELATDGDTPSALDWIELAYTARPSP